MVASLTSPSPSSRCWYVTNGESSTSGFRVSGCGHPAECLCVPTSALHILGFYWAFFGRRDVCFQGAAGFDTDAASGYGLTQRGVAIESLQFVEHVLKVPFVGPASCREDVSGRMVSCSVGETVGGLGGHDSHRCYCR